MLLKHKYYLKSTKILWSRPLLWAIYSSIIVVLFKTYQIDINIPMTIPSILGTAISLFLGFRTNSAYQRWWEARKIWGEIVNNSRTFARQVINFGDTAKEIDIRTHLIHRQIAWNWSLAYRLRKLGWSKEAETYLDSTEVEKLKKKEHIPNLLLLQQGKDLNKLKQVNGIDDFYLRKINSTLKELCDSMGKCERIKTTVFPTQYALFTLIFINIFLFILPMGIVESLGYYTIPIHISIGFTFAMIQNIAESMQEPFENKPNDIPLFSMCRTIERNILEMMGNNTLPEHYKEQDGIMM